MNRLSSIVVIGGLLILASCSQEELIKTPQQQGSMPISFRAGVATRVNPDHDYTKNPAAFYVSSYADNHKSEEGIISEPLFWNEPFNLAGANLYTSTSNQKWPENVNQIEFFAYAPSLEEIQAAAFTQLDPSAENHNVLIENYRNTMQFFNLCDDGAALDPVNETNTFDDVTLNKGFKLGRFYVATDISKQVDFITAHTVAPRPKDDDEAELGIKLEFKHQLSNIELRAFSNHPEYNIEIAGVRLGRPYTGDAMFNFCDVDGDVTAGGQWCFSKKPQRLPVEYIYSEGDTIYRMGVFNTVSGNEVVSTPVHTTPATATHIMGKGGNAMVLPTKNAAWSAEGNPWIAPEYAETQGLKKPKEWNAETEGDMYFSILIRVTLRHENNQITTKQVYPYVNSGMNIVYIEKEKNSGKVIGRSSKDATAGTDNEIVEFGWAAVPVGVNWERGKKYIYTLDFSEGIGVQDPEDPRPGKPIIGEPVKFSVSVAGWDEQTLPFPIPNE